MLEAFVDNVMKNEAGYVSGFAVHWYLDFLSTPEVFDAVHRKYPHQFILATEACNGASPLDNPKVKLGDWGRAKNYIRSIMSDLQHWVTGWTDWNIALNTQGGVNWVKNYVDSPVIVDAGRGEYLKQPMFYALGQFSKFVTPGSTRIGLNINSKHLDAVAFEADKNKTVVVVHNQEDKKRTVKLIDSKVGDVTIDVEPESIKTIVWATD